MPKEYRMAISGRNECRILGVVIVLLSMALGGGTRALARSESLGVSVDSRLPAIQIGQVGAVSVVEGTAYFATESGIHALDAETGEINWSGDASYSSALPPAIDGDSLYTGNLDGSIRSLSTETGTERWSFETDSAIVYEIAVGDGAVYGSTFDGVWFAIDAVSGEQRWAIDTATGAPTTPAVAGGIVYFGSPDTSVYALDAATGETVWTFDTGGEVRSTPIVVDGLVYINSWDGNLYAIDAASGQERWRFETGYAIQLRPAVVDGVVYVNTFGGDIVALDAGTGEEHWSAATHGFTANSPGVGDGLVAAGNGEGAFTAFNAGTGQERWSIPMPDTVEDAPFVNDGKVYVTNRENRFAALDTENGRELWAFEFGETDISAPAFHPGLVLLGTSDGTLSAFETETGRQAWSTDTQVASTTAPFFTLHLLDGRYEPSQLELPADREVNVRIENAGVASLSFVAPALDIDIVLPPGESADIAIEAPAGDYEFFCEMPGHKAAGMTGTLHASTPTVHQIDPRPLAIVSSAAGETALQSLLPDVEELEGRWTVQSEGSRSREDVMTLFGDDGEELIDSLGWRDNAFRNFELVNMLDDLYATSNLTVSIHAFADSDGAAGALHPLSQWVADSEGMEPMQPDLSVEGALAFGGKPGNLPTFVIYVLHDNLLIRVGGTSLLGDPIKDVTTVTELVLAKAAGKIPAASPVASSAATGSNSEPQQIAIGPVASDSGSPADSAISGAADLLPESADFEGVWLIDDEGERTDTDVALQFGDAGRALLREWGWHENHYRNFARAHPEQFSNDVTVVNVSVHEFIDSAGAASALDPLAQIVPDTLGLDEIPLEGLGDAARGFSGPGVGLNLTVLFVQADNFLIRVGASSEFGDPTNMAIQVAELILAKADGGSAASRVANPVAEAT
jgi:outer membrane protein assembly factor BamB